jgi:fused signal recognition particle receptor
VLRFIIFLRLILICFLQPAATGASPLAKLGQVLREKARGDFERVFKGTEKTRQKLSVVDELLTYWDIDQADEQLEELEDALICVDFGPKTAFKIADDIRERILRGGAFASVIQSHAIVK